jgi:hypothetical protein
MADDKPTFASVTHTPCTCGYLQEAADDPANPIEFDQETNEFQFKYRDRQCDSQDICQGMLVIYHCPFCGGAAPKSKRHLLFAKIPQAEEARLASLLTPIRTVSDAIEKFGSPDFDDYSVTRSRESEDPPAQRAVERSPLLSFILRVCRSGGGGKLCFGLRWQREDFRV